MIELLRVLIVILAAITTVVAMVYGIRSPWYRSQVGQRLFADRVVMAGLLWLQVISATGVRMPLEVWVGCITLFICIEIWNFLLIIRAQSEAKRLRSGK